MASLKIHPHSSYWHACITMHDGRQTQKSTKLRRDEVSREKAQIYADTLEKAYRVKRAEAQFRRLMADAWFAISGSELPASTVGAFFGRWLTRRKNEVDHSSFL